MAMASRSVMSVCATWATATESVKRVRAAASAPTSSVGHCLTIPRSQARRVLVALLLSRVTSRTTAIAARLLDQLEEAAPSCRVPVSAGSSCVSMCVVLPKDPIAISGG